MDEIHGGVSVSCAGAAASCLPVLAFGHPQSPQDLRPPEASTQLLPQVTLFLLGLSDW